MPRTPRAWRRKAPTRKAAAAPMRPPFSVSSRPADGSKVLVHTNLTLSGAVAQYGRGVGIIQATAAQLMNQFAKCLKEKLAQDHPAAPLPPPLQPSPSIVPPGAPPAAPQPPSASPPRAAAAPRVPRRRRSRFQALR